MLSSLFYQNHNSLPLVLSKILNKAEHQIEQIPEGPTKLTELKDLFPDKPASMLHQCLCATEGEISKAVELVQTLQDIYAREGTPLAHDLLLSSGNRPKNSALVLPTVPNKLAATKGDGTGNLSPGMAFERPPSAHECVSLALTIRSKRDDAYRSAARSWQAKHSLGNSGVAAYWAEHGRHLDRQAREWELRAARATVDERRRQARSLQTVDLHGLSVAQALTVTQECLTAWWTCKCSSSSGLSPNSRPLKLSFCESCYSTNLISSPYHNHGCW